MGVALVLLVVSIFVINYTSAKPCEGSSSASECRVIVSCKEKDPDQSSIEVEIQRLPESTQLVKFTQKADGTRNAVVTVPVTLTEVDDSAKYESTPAGKAVLDLNKRAQTGEFEEPADKEQGKIGMLCESLD